MLFFLTNIVKKLSGDAFFSTENTSDQVNFKKKKKKENFKKKKSKTTECITYRLE